MELKSLFDSNTLAQISLRIVVIIALGWLLMQGLRMLLLRLEKHLLRQQATAGEMPWESQRRVETLTRLMRQGVRVVLIVVLGLAILMQLGVQVGPLIASAGVAGVAIGFGAQNLVRDAFAGFFLILENQVRVGDVAVVNGTTGLVETVSFRTLTLRDSAGVVHVFQNGAISTLANMTREWSAYVFNLSVAYKEDIDRVIETIRQVGHELRQDSAFGPLMLEEPEIFGVDKLTDSAVIIQGRIKTRPIKQWDVGREFLRRIKYAFDKAGIEMPSAPRTIAVVDAARLLQAALVRETAADQL